MGPETLSIVQHESEVEILPSFKQVVVIRSAAGAHFLALLARPAFVYSFVAVAIFALTVAITQSAFTLGEHHGLQRGNMFANQVLLQNGRHDQPQVLQIQIAKDGSKYWPLATELSPPAPQHKPDRVRPQTNPALRLLLTAPENNADSWFPEEPEIQISNN